MKRQILHTVLCNIAGEAAGEFLDWSLLGVKGLRELGWLRRQGDKNAGLSTQGWNGERRTKKLTSKRQLITVFRYLY